MNKKSKRMTLSAMIGAIYFICCFVEQSFASGAIQCRLSEGLTLLPLIFPEAILGITVGCLIFNIYTGVLWDIIFGTLTTLLAGILTYVIGRLIKNEGLKIFIGGLFPVFLNALVIPVILYNGYGVNDGYFFLVLTIAIGQIIAVYGVGTLIYFPLKKYLIDYKDINN